MNSRTHGLAFRSATSADIERIMALEAAGFAPGHWESAAVYERRIAVFPEGSLMVEAGSQTVGCFFSEIWQPTAQPARAHFTLGHDIAERHDPLRGSELYISSMTLDPAFRGQGLGTPFFEGCLEHVAGQFPRIASLLLLVNASWSNARRVYGHAGFREILRLTDFFSPDGKQREDGIVMRRPARPRNPRP